MLYNKKYSYRNVLSVDKRTKFEYRLWVRWMVLKFQLVADSSLVGLSNNRWLNPNPRISDSICLGWRPRIRISNKFPSDVDATGLGSHSEKH
jgi:hypothetical protein